MPYATLDIRLKTYFPVFFCFESFAVAVGHKGFDSVTFVAIKDIVDGIMTGDVLNLASTEVVLFSEGLGVRL